MMAIVHARPETGWYEIHTAAGAFTARIASPATLPAPPFRAAFEFTIDLPVFLGENAAETAPGEYRIGTSAGTTTLRGHVDSRDDDVVHFRLGPDALMMLEMSGTGTRPGQWLELRFPAEEVVVYIYDLLGPDDDVVYYEN